MQEKNTPGAKITGQGCLALAGGKSLSWRSCNYVLGFVSFQQTPSMTIKNNDFVWGWEELIKLITVFGARRICASYY